MIVMPQYGVWQKELRGKAALKEAEWNRQIAVEEAQALKMSATLLAEAEVERAKGVAEANEIIGESLKENEAYLRYLWIIGLQDGSSEVIYIPTEGNMPILEATRGLK
jgi:regulator of protease activity HflC (stomatin/prohibitin superfamily)